METDADNPLYLIALTKRHLATIEATGLSAREIIEKICGEAHVPKTTSLAALLKGIIETSRSKFPTEEDAIGKIKRLKAHGVDGPSEVELSFREDTRRQIAEALSAIFFFIFTLFEHVPHCLVLGAA